MIAASSASCPTALGALCGQLRFLPPWCREHSTVTATEPFQPLDVACEILFRSSCASQTSPTDCSDDSWRDTFFWKAWTRRSVTSDIWRLRKKLTYVLTYNLERMLTRWWMGYLIVNLVCRLRLDIKAKRMNWLIYVLRDHKPCVLSSISALKVTQRSRSSITKIRSTSMVHDNTYR